MQLWYHSCLTSLDHMVSKFKRSKYELLENPPVLTSKLFRKNKAIKTRNMKWQFYINKGPNHFYSLLNICHHITFRKNLSKQIFQKRVFVFLGPRMSMVWRGVWGRPFQISPPPPSNLCPPVIQGSKVIPFSPSILHLIHWVRSTESKM